jgi:hypothetical protein
VDACGGEVVANVAVGRGVAGLTDGRGVSIPDEQAATSKPLSTVSAVRALIGPMEFRPSLKRCRFRID